MRPGTNTTIQSQAQSQAAPNNTGTWFVAGITSQGPVVPTLATSFAAWQTAFGQRGSNPILSDSVETYFARGGSQVYTARVVGPSAANAAVTLKDASAANTLTIAAQGPGAYANGWQIVVATVSGGFTISVEDANSNVLETSATLTDVPDAVTYGSASSYITVTAVGTTIPANGTFAMTAGADDLTDITTTQYQTSLESFTDDLGPGIVSVPGVTTAGVLAALADVCNGSTRVAAGDLPDTGTVATLVSTAAGVRALGVPARAIGLFAPWCDIAPAIGTTGNRPVPPSAFYAGAAAANDSATGNPNLPIAGKNGILPNVVNVHYSWSDTDRQTLNTAGVNVIRSMSNGFRIYGNVTAVNRVTDPLYFMLSNVRLDAAILNEANAIQEDLMFSQIDGLGLDAAAYGAELISMLTEWQSAPKYAIYGNPTVDFSSDVNTPTTASEGELLATIGYSRSPGAEQVNLAIFRQSAGS